MVFGAQDINITERKFTLADAVPPNSQFIPIESLKLIAVVCYVAKPIDGELFYISWNGERLFRRITRTNGRITLVSKTGKTIIPEETENELEIIGKVIFTISFPNSVSDNIIDVLNKLMQRF